MVSRNDSDVYPGTVTTAFGETTAGAHDKPLCDAAPGQFVDQKLSLAFTSAVAGGKIQLTNQRQPRYHKASRPVILIVIVYGSAMITILP